MKKIFFLLLIIPFAFGCDGGSVNNNNPNIPNYPVNLQINLNLPAYSNLQFPSNRIVDYSQGARGIVVFNTGSGYVAYDLACPNIAFTLCTEPMSVPVGNINATCGCDNTVYSLFTGQSPGQPYPMKQYRVDINGSTLVIYN
jgi:nitrite reductase/ring-hydroxylating ferredoxin subunit